MTHIESSERLLWKTVSLSLSLHVIFGWLLIQGGALMRQATPPQLITVELREMPAAPLPLSSVREKTVHTKVTAIQKARIEHHTTLQPQATVESQPVSHPVHLLTKPQQILDSVTAEHAREQHDLLPSPSVASSKSIAPVANQPQRALPVKESSASASAKLSYFSLIRERLERNKVYPALARRGRMEGAVTVQFTILHDGTAGSVRLAKSSGYTVLDQAALRTVRDAEPFPIPPQSLMSGETSVRVPLLFKMD